MGRMLSGLVSFRLCRTVGVTQIEGERTGVLYLVDHPGIVKYLGIHI